MRLHKHLVHVIFLDVYHEIYKPLVNVVFSHMVMRYINPWSMFDTIFYKTKGYQAESRPVINNVHTRIITLPTIELCKIAFLTYIKEPDWYLTRTDHQEKE